MQVELSPLFVTEVLHHHGIMGEAQTPTEQCERLKQWSTESHKHHTTQQQRFTATVAYSVIEYLIKLCARSNQVTPDEPCPDVKRSSTLQLTVLKHSSITSGKVATPLAGHIKDSTNARG